MDNILRYLAKNAISAIMVTIVTGLTITTSAAGTVKLLGSINSVKTTVPEVKDVQALDNETPTPTVTKKTKTVSSVVGNLLGKISPTLAPTSVPTIAPVNSAQNNNGCVISLFGKQYDVLALQSTHSGGNIFKCNTDMTATYQGKHGTDVSRMQKYLLASSGGTTNSSGGSQNSPTTDPTSGSVSSGTEIKTENHRENDDDREDRVQEDDEKHIENEDEDE